MAKAFRFRLAKLLDLRLRERDEQRMRFARAFKACHEVDEMIAALNQELVTDKLPRKDDKTARHERDLIDVEVMRCHEHYWRATQQRIADARLRRVTLQEQLQAERERLIEASRKVKVIEKLRERRWAEHEKMLLEAERRADDDRSAARYAANMRAWDNGIQGSFETREATDARFELPGERGMRRA